MSSWNAPYATLHDLPKYEKRPDVAGAPWSRDQAAVKSSRGQDPLPYVTCNSRTAPFATFHNTPNEADPKAEVTFLAMNLLICTFISSVLVQDMVLMPSEKNCADVPLIIFLFLCVRHHVCCSFFSCYRTKSSCMNLDGQNILYTNTVLTK